MASTVLLATSSGAAHAFTEKTGTESGAGFASNPPASPAGLHSAQAHDVYAYYICASRLQCAA